MYSHTDGGLKDKLRNNGAFWGIILVGGLLAAFWAVSKYKNRKRKGGKKRRSR